MTERDTNGRISFVFDSHSGYRHNRGMTSTKPLRVVVAINPSASFGRGGTVGPAVVQSLRGAGHDVTMLTEPSFAELAESAKKAVATKPDALVVVGGDGMVSLGTNVLAGSKVPLGIVPSGTGNDMSRGLGIPVGNTEAAIEYLLDALRRPPRVIDTGRVRHGDGEETWFACVLSAGFDAVVNERANQMRWPKGKSRYNLALLRELAMLNPIHYRLTLDGAVIDTDAMLVSVGNNTSMGGGMLVTPDALLDDGMFDVLVVQPLSRLATALSGYGVDGLVFDRTGLTGNFDIELQWTPENLRAISAGEGPSLFTALQEQLGLKLESARGPVEYLVIDSAELPTPD